MNRLQDPHADQKVLFAGPAPEQAAVTLILIHGRGASAESILEIHEVLGIGNVAAVAPQAAGHTWYPHSFLSPMASNQPYLNSALGRIESLVDDLIGRGISSRRIALLGFSQGACLASEFAARHPRRYGAIVALSGGLIGPAGTARNYPGSLEGTPVLLGSADPDPHVPFDRVRETDLTFGRMGGVVDLRRYPGMAHTINQDEISACRQIISQIVRDSPERA